MSMPVSRVVGVLVLVAKDDGRTLAEDFSRLAAPLPELMLFGGMMITRGEAAELLKADRSLHAFGLGVRLAGRYIIDRLRYPRGTRLVVGNALVARLSDVEAHEDAQCTRRLDQPRKRSDIIDRQ